MDGQLHLYFLRPMVCMSPIIVVVLYVARGRRVLAPVSADAHRARFPAHFGLCAVFVISREGVGLVIDLLPS